jgi:tyrosine-protein kinase Etk/Wzc
MEIRRLLETLYARRAVFFSVAAVILFAGLFLSMFFRDSYTATSKILIAKSHSGEELLFSVSESVPGGRKADMDRQVDILKSGPVINEVIKELDLRDEKGALLGIEKVLGRIKTVPVWEADIIEIRAYSRRPGEAAALANSAARQYVRWVQRLKKEELESTVRYLSAELDKIKAGQQALEKDAAAFKKTGVKAEISDELAVKAGKSAEALIEKAKIEAEIKRTKTAGLFGSDSDRVSSLMRQLEIIEKAISKHEEDSAALPEPERKLYSFARDRRAFNTLYPVFAHKLNEIKVSEALNTSPVQIVSYAGSERKPVRANGAAALLPLALIAAFAGLTAVFGAEYMDQSIRCCEDVSRDLGMKMLGHTPAFNLPDFSRRNEIVIGGSDDYGLLFGLMKDISASVDGALPAEKRKTVAFVSPLRDDGKSFVAAAFASYMASSGQKVLLVDSDIRTRLVSRIYPGISEEGFAEAVFDGKNVLNLIRGTSDPFVDVLKAGRPGVFETSRTLFDRNAVGQVLSSAAAVYSAVIVDCPAADGRSGSIEILSSCDAAVLIVPSGRLDKKTVLDSVSMMEKAGVKFAGVVLSDIRTGGN